MPPSWSARVEWPYRAALEPHQQSDSITHAIDCRRRTTTPRGRQPTDPTASFVSAHRESFSNVEAPAHANGIKARPANLAAQQAIAVLTAEGLDPFAALPPFGERSDPSRSPLHWAAAAGDAAAVGALLRAGAARHARCALGNTALHLAAAQCSPSCVDTLLARPETRAPQLRARNRAGLTPREVAANRQASCPPLSELWRRARSTLRALDGECPEDLPDAHHAAKPSKRAIISTAAESESGVAQPRDRSATIVSANAHFLLRSAAPIEAAAAALRKRAPVENDEARLHFMEAERSLHAYAAAAESAGLNPPPPPQPAPAAALALDAGLPSPPPLKKSAEPSGVPKGSGAQTDCKGDGVYVDEKGRCHGPLADPGPRNSSARVRSMSLPDAVKLMLSAGVNPAVVLPPGSLRGSKEKSLREEDRRTALHWAAAAGDATAVKLLLLSGEQRGSRDVYGDTPLHLAAAGGHASVVRELLIDVDSTLCAARNRAGCTALDMAKNRKRACAPDSKWRRAADLAVQLLRGVDTAEGTDSIARPGRPRQQPSKNHGHSVPFPMWTGAFTQPAPALASADDACAVLSAAGLADAALVLRAFRPRDPARTPLHWAAAAGHAKAVEVLLEAGARDVVDSSGNGALHLGALRLDAPVLKALLAADAGRVRDARNRAGHTPLALALTRASKLARGSKGARQAAAAVGLLRRGA